MYCLCVCVRTRCPSPVWRWRVSWRPGSGPASGAPTTAASWGRSTPSSRGGPCRTGPPCVSEEKVERKDKKEMLNIIIRGGVRHGQLMLASICVSVNGLALLQGKSNQKLNHISVQLPCLLLFRELQRELKPMPTSYWPRGRATANRNSLSHS